MARVVADLVDVWGHVAPPSDSSPAGRPTDWRKSAGGFRPARRRPAGCRRRSAQCPPRPRSKRVDLCDGRVDVLRVRGGHALDGNRMSGADRDRADANGTRRVALDQHGSSSFSILRWGGPGPPTGSDHRNGSIPAARTGGDGSGQARPLFPTANSLAMSRSAEETRQAHRMDKILGSLRLGKPVQKREKAGVFAPSRVDLRVVWAASLTGSSGGCVIDSNLLSVRGRIRRRSSPTSFQQTFFVESGRFNPIKGGACGDCSGSVV